MIERHVLEQRILGRSGLEVSSLGFGGAPLGDLFARLDEGEAIATLTHALDGGISLIDTSPLYGHGLSEHRIGAALRQRPDAKVVLCTKVGRVMHPMRPRGGGSGYVGGMPHAARYDYSHDGALRSLEQSLLRLGRDHVDILLIHDLDVWTHGEALEGYYREAMRGALRALLDLRSQGVIRAIGIGVNEADMAERFAREADIDAVLLAGRYSLLEQPALERFLPLAQARNIGVMLGGVFNSGILATGAVPGARYNYNAAPPAILAKVRAIEAVCARHGVPLARAALQFALAHPAVCAIVMGAVKPAEIDQQSEALAAAVPAELYAELKREGLLDEAAPVPS